MEENRSHDGVRLKQMSFSQLTYPSDQHVVKVQYKLFLHFDLLYH